MRRSFGDPSIGSEQQESDWKMCVTFPGSIFISIFHFRFSLAHLKDPLAQNELLHLVLAEFQEALNQLWDKLPIDTVIATILDPRVKNSLKGLPAEELNIAVETMKKV